MATLLTIDDDAALRKAIAKALRLSGYTVLEAEDGQKGLELALLRGPDLVITDVMMPVLDGVEAIKRIRASRPDLPIIAISGSDTAWAAAQTFGRVGWGNHDSPYSPLAQARMEGADRRRRRRSSTTCARTGRGAGPSSARALRSRRRARTPATRRSSWPAGWRAGTGSRACWSTTTTGRSTLGTRTATKPKGRHLGRALEFIKDQYRCGRGAPR